MGKILKCPFCGNDEPFLLRSDTSCKKGMSHYTAERLSVKCMKCGAESPGVMLRAVRGREGELWHLSDDDIEESIRLWNARDRGML